MTGRIGIGTPIAAVGVLISALVLVLAPTASAARPLFLKSEGNVAPVGTQVAAVFELAVTAREGTPPPKSICQIAQREGTLEANGAPTDKATFTTEPEVLNCNEGLSISGRITTEELTGKNKVKITTAAKLTLTFPGPCAYQTTKKLSLAFPIPEEELLARNESLGKLNSKVSAPTCASEIIFDGAASLIPETTFQFFEVSY